MEIVKVDNRLAWKFVSDHARRNFRDHHAGQIRVLYRADPVHKHVLVCALQIVGATVAVVGDSISDAVSMTQADVGISMGGSGCPVTRVCSDIIFTDDNFVSIHTALRWGRNIYESIKKFIQFQLTMNIAVIGTVFLGAVSLGRSPFSAMQLLWLNLIMDVFAALALATESPHPEGLIARARRHNENDQILPVMYRSIYSQALYQFLVMATLLYAGPTMFGTQYPLVWEPLYTDDKPTHRLQHYTMMFHTFVLMNLCNMFNCRVIGGQDENQTAMTSQFNICARITDNWWFIFLFLVELNFQYAIISWPVLQMVFGCSGLTRNMHIGALSFAVGSLLVSALVKLTPFRWSLSLCTIAETDQGGQSKIGQKVEKWFVDPRAKNPHEKLLE